MVALNYAAKLLVILLGMAVLSGIPPFDGMASPMREIFASVVILFGTYRLLSFAIFRRRTLREESHE